jgi:xanthine dehydrogenase/oxidase
MIYPMYFSSYRYNVLVAVNRNDGSVSVSHGGIECGQGINTKVTYDPFVIFNKLFYFR